MGEWRRSNGPTSTKAARLIGAGALGILLGLAWSTVFPINKSLWTSSYVVFTAGMACVVLAACYWLIDVQQWRTWGKPFVIFGMNAIAAFFLSSLGARLLGMIEVGSPPASLKAWLYRAGFASWLSRYNASLAFALTYTAFWLAIMGVLYHRRIFIKV